MRIVFAFLVAILGYASAPARADILVTVDKSAQRMTVSRDGQILYNWPVSTGVPGHATPSGSFRAFRMEADHFSKEWDDAPMPYSIFFTQVGHAIHGTEKASKLGSPASHGCVRLSVSHAAKLYELVQQEGVLKTKVVLTGSEQIALKRGRVMTADRDDDSSVQQPQYGSDARDSDQRGYDSRYPDPRYGYDPRYDQRQYDDPRYAGPQYYGYSERDDRPQPRYMRPDPYYRGYYGNY